MPLTCKYIIDIDSDDILPHAKKTLEFMVKDVESSKKYWHDWILVDGISGKEMLTKMRNCN